ncbi:MAG: hypothetical protein IEMM0002_1224 [bacterium]|nr:MAG: hypothetical protein IEMM0002_1224 [bacterium]
MKRATVILVNAAVLPGMGHLLKKNYFSGAFMVVCFTVATIVMIVKIVYGLFVFYGSRYGFSDFPLFFISLWDDATFRYSLYSTVMIWIFSIADSFRITRNS